MGILLAFAPFIVFAIVDRLAGATAGLAAGPLFPRPCSRGTG